MLSWGISWMPVSLLWSVRLPRRCGRTGVCESSLRFIFWPSKPCCSYRMTLLVKLWSCMRTLGSWVCACLHLCTTDSSRNVWERLRRFQLQQLQSLLTVRTRQSRSCLMMRLWSTCAAHSRLQTASHGMATSLEELQLPRSAHWLGSTGTLQPCPCQCARSWSLVQTLKELQAGLAETGNALLRLLWRISGATGASLQSCLGVSFGLSKPPPALTLTGL
mmetsp:Transcript_93348/g.179511  ORF Transcript_93348/g.179511 Transcript_93348/m.179511 type:complete len:219 (+) Transcript_93348:478-1134(+)